MMKSLRKTLLLAAFVAGWSAQGASFSHNLNTDPTADGITLRGNAVWRGTGSHDGSGYISLTDALTGQNSLVVLPDLDPGFATVGFSLKMKVRIGGGTSRPADGMSVSFVDASDGIVGAGVLGAGEEGPATGLVVSIDTWDNGGGDGPAIDVKVDNVIIAHKRYAGTGPQTSSPGPYCAPVERDAAGNPISLHTGASWTDFEMTLTMGGTLTVKYKGMDIFKDLPTGYPVRSGRFIIGGRTGGATDNHWIDDLVVTTETADPPPRLLATSPTGNPGRDTSELAPVTFVIDAFLSFLDPVRESIKLVIDGTDVTADLNTTIVDDPFARTTTITYTPSPQWAAGSSHEAVLSYRDNNEPPLTITGRKVWHVTPVPRTSSLGDSLFIEAEDFNYTDGTTAGLYKDFGSPAGSYDGLPARHDTDYHLNGSNPESALYRVLNPPNGISVPGVPDNMRAGVAISPDYKVGWNDSGDWFNFTRTFPNTTYKIYGRFASGGADTHARLDKVTSDPKVPNQTTTPLGTFDGDATSGWDTFCFIPLRDASGNDVIVRLNGETTLRVTCLPGNYDYNYLAFVPTFSPTLRPLVANVTPAAGSSDSLRNPTIKVSIVDRDTQVNPSSIRLFLDGVELTPIVVTDTAAGADAEFQTTASLPAGSAHTAKVVYSDNDAIPVSLTNEWSFTVGVFKGFGQTLFIEAEDFNYTDDGVTGGLHANFGDPDCSLRNKDAIKGVDYDEGDDGNAAPAYRPATGVEADKQGTDGYLRADRTITCNYIVGWNDPGDWYNYTRDFGASTRYNIYARLSSGGAAENAELAAITSNPAAPNQTKQVLGTFNAPATGNWDIFHTVPLRDGSGALASVRLGGTQTLRLSQLPGNFDYNYLALVVADVQTLTPTVASVQPAPNSEHNRAPRITVVIADQDTAVVASSLKLIVDGNDVTPFSTITDTAQGASISYQSLPGSPVGTVHNASVQWQDNQATPVNGSFSWTYKEGVYNPDSNLFIESEDFNTANGEFLPSNGANPFNAKGLYNTLGATPEVDYHDSGDGQESNQYRTEGVNNLPHVNMSPAGHDANVGGAGARPGFTVVGDFKIGWTDSAGGGGGDWYNYTRNYGAGGTYKVYLRVAHGDGAATMGGRLETVEGASGTGQSTSFLGRFRAPATGGWDTYTFVEMKAEDGSPAVIPLSGVKTLRYTVEANGGDLNYLMLVPQLAANQCPVASSSEQTVNQNGSANFQLSGTDPDGNTLLYTVTQQPAHGTVTVSPLTGAATYTPAAGYCGADTFRFNVSDGVCTSTDATVGITVINCNACPVASNSSTTVQEDSSVNFQLQATDADGDALTYAVTQPTTHGTLTVNPATGAASYSPNSGYVGPDSFKFKANDGKCDSGEATVSITVTPKPNIPPSCVARLTPDACVLTFPPQTQQYILSLNETDACIVLDGSGSADADGDSLTYSWSSGANTLGTGAVLPVCLPVGCHTITLTVSDGRDTCTSTIEVCVIIASEAVEQIVKLVDDASVVRKNKRPLIASLKAAGASFDRGSWGSAQGQLGAFQNKCRAQIGKDNPAEAAAFIEAVQKLLDAVECATEMQPAQP